MSFEAIFPGYRPDVLAAGERATVVEDEAFGALRHACGELGQPHQQVVVEELQGCRLLPLFQQVCNEGQLVNQMIVGHDAPVQRRDAMAPVEVAHRERRPLQHQVIVVAPHRLAR